MKLYNSLTRRTDDVGPGELGIYVCGITPYDSPHLGHARAAVIFDAFTRYLRAQGRAVKYIRNVTDVEDKIIERANETGTHYQALVKKYLDEYHSLLDSLGCATPDQEPKVSENIPDVISLIERLITKGLAYSTAGSVYFSVQSFDGYGALSGRDPEELLAGTRVTKADEKRNPLDFALWKAAAPDEPFWPSPWGPGRPGWHIECSAMSMKFLGETFAIHGGGNDLIFPHHENERAQSEGATGSPYARIWMHNGMVTIDGRKMSKSLGNAPGSFELLEKYGARLLRYFMLSSHYSSPLDFSEKNMIAARNALERFDTLGGAPGEPLQTGITRDFLAALEDNFNTPRAFAALFDGVTAANKGDEMFKSAARAEISECGKMLGLELFPEQSGDDEIEKLIDERDRARAEKNFKRADEIRAIFAERGIIIEDGKDGTRWRR